MDNNYENFLRELSNHYAGRSGALSAGIECVAWQTNIPGVTVTDYKAFSAFLKAKADEINARYNEELQKITLRSN